MAKTGRAGRHGTGWESLDRKEERKKKRKKKIFPSCFLEWKTLTALSKMVYYGDRLLVPVYVHGDTFLVILSWLLTSELLGQSY